MIPVGSVITITIRSLQSKAPWVLFSAISSECRSSHRAPVCPEAKAISTVDINVSFVCSVGERCSNVTLISEQFTGFYMWNCVSLQVQDVFKRVSVHFFTACFISDFLIINPLAAHRLCFSSSDFQFLFHYSKARNSVGAVQHQVSRSSRDHTPRHLLHLYVKPIDSCWYMQTFIAHKTHKACFISLIWDIENQV